MASAFTHVFAAASLGAVITPGRVVPRLLVVGALCSVVPDLDVLGLRLGLAYGDLLGHRGLSHSLVCGKNNAKTAETHAVNATSGKLVRTLSTS